MPLISARGSVDMRGGGKGSKGSKDLIMGPHIRSGDDVRQLSKLPISIPDIPYLCVSHGNVRVEPKTAGGGAGGLAGVATGSEKGRLSHDKGPPEADLKRQREFPTNETLLKRAFQAVGSLNASHSPR